MRILGLNTTSANQSTENFRSYRESEKTAIPSQWNPKPINNCEILDQSLDSSMAEYDCADEAMDGPDSVCIDDMILAQNRNRVEQMSI